MKLICPIRGTLNINDKSKDGLHFTEEKIRIDCINFLIAKGYPKEHIEFEENIWNIGSNGRNHLRADIVVFKNKLKDIEDIDIIVETKRDTKDRDEAIKNQLLPACVKTKCNYGIYFDGVNNTLFTKTTEYQIEHSILKLPSYGFKFDQTPLIYSNLIPIENINALIDIFDQLLHNVGKTKEEKYKELFKIILCKYYDEKQHEDDNAFLDFQYSNNIIDKINTLYKNAQTFYKNLDLKENIDISDQILIKIVKLLQNYSLLKSQQDILQTLFMKFAQSTLKTELDQFYTPISIVNFIVSLLKIPNTCKIIDPAGGSGDFLVGCLKKNHKISQNIYYWDASSKAVEVAQLNMIISGDGRSNITMHDSIEKANEHNNIFDIVITNPPFGSKTVFSGPKKCLESYSLYKDYQYSQLGRLFIERSIKLLKNNGILCIILPHGYLTNPIEDTHLREFIAQTARIIGYISLPEGAFKGAETGVKTGILILRKEENIPNEYNIFTDVAVNIGFNYKSKKLEKVYKQNIQNGEYELDESNNKIILSDLDNIALKFQKFAYDNSLDNFIQKNHNTDYQFSTYSDIKKNKHMIRPELNTLLYTNTIKNIKRNEVYKLDDCCISNTKSISITSSNIYSYIDISSMFTGDYSLNNKLYGWELPKRAKQSVNKYDIFISKLKGSLDKFCMILHDNTTNTVFTNGCYKIVIEDEHKRLSFYKFLFSQQYLIQMESLATGSIMLDVKDDDLKNYFVFPKLSKDEFDNMKSLIHNQELFIKLKYNL